MKAASGISTSWRCTNRSAAGGARGQGEKCAEGPENGQRAQRPAIHGPPPAADDACIGAREPAHGVVSLLPGPGAGPSARLTSMPARLWTRARKASPRASKSRH
jgi:hypothetical protein